MKDAIEVKGAEIGNARHVSQRDRLAKPSTRTRDHALDGASVGRDRVFAARRIRGIVKREVCEVCAGRAAAGPRIVGGRELRWCAL